jgi:hypothetical protein
MYRLTLKIAIPESELFGGTSPGAAMHPDYTVPRALRGFLVSYSLPPLAIAFGRRIRQRINNGSARV